MRLGLEAVEDMAVEDMAAAAVAVEHRTRWAVAATLAAAAISAELGSAADRVSAGVSASAERVLAEPDLRCPGLRLGRVSTPNAHLLFGALRTGPRAATQW
jgi:hypothetical protein